MTFVSQEEKMMHSRLYRLFEKHQRIDERLRIAQQRRQPDPTEILRLTALKMRAKELILRFTRTPART